MMKDPLDGLVGLTPEQVSELIGKLDAGPLLRLHCPQDAPRGATSLLLIHAPRATVWDIIERPEAFPTFVRMVDSVQRQPSKQGEELFRVDLRFKISIFSKKFHFVAAAQHDPGRLTELVFRDGKVRDVHIQLELLEVDEGRTLLRCHVSFDQTSLGWLVKVFISHHPEIEWGVHAGSALSIGTSVRREAEALRARRAA